MKPIRLAFFTALALALAAAAPAQTGTQAWVAGRVILDVDSSILSTTAVGPAGGAAFGIDGRRIGFQVALDWPVPHTSDYVGTFQDPLVGPVRMTVRRTSSSPSWQALLAFHPWSGSRLRLSLLAGFTSVTHRDAGFTVVSERLGPNGEVLERAETPVPGRNNWWPGFAFGADVVIRLSSHVALVPEVRVMAFPGADSDGGIFRPAAGVRWTF